MADHIEVDYGYYRNGQSPLELLGRVGFDGTLITISRRQSHTTTIPLSGVTSFSYYYERKRGDLTVYTNDGKSETLSFDRRQEPGFRRLHAALRSAFTR